MFPLEDIEKLPEFVLPSIRFNNILKHDGKMTAILVLKAVLFP